MSGILICPFHVTDGHVVRVGIEVVGQNVVAVLIACVINNAHEPLFHVAPKLVGSFPCECITLQVVLVGEAVY